MAQVPLNEALHQAIVHHNGGRLQQAEAIYRQILVAIPDHADALHLLGVIAHQCNRHESAIELIGKSLAIEPVNAAANNNLGEAFRLTGKSDEAIEAYKRAVAQNPQSAEALGNIGLVLFNQEKIDESLEYFYKALAVNPRLPQALSNLGNALQKKGEIERAMAAYEAAIVADPMLADAHNNRGSALEHLDRLDEAYDEYRRATEINPRFAIACNNAANVSRRLARWEEARAWCRRALELNPDLDAAKWNEGLIDLTLGFYAIGLPKYELRFIATSQRLPKDLFGVKWDGSPLDGKTLLLVGEQGLGDTLQAARYLPRLAAMGGRVVMECAAQIAPMLRRMPGVDEVSVAGDARPDFDFYVPMMSLPLMLNTTLTTIENRVPYLPTQPDRIEFWQAQLSQYGEEKRIGLLWSGSPVPEPLRSCKLTDLAPLARVPGVRFFSLQVGRGAEQASSPPVGMDLVDLSVDVQSFEETAACMENLDLIITIDTAAAHLAGGLARPTWMVLPLSPDWRWMLDRDDSPWYPTMRLFRQTVRKQWGDVMERVSEALMDWARGAE